MRRDTDQIDNPRRKRGAAATKDAILQAGLRGFCAHGYDGIGVREIAASAGVTAVLVNRYFGSKEELFAVVVDTVFSGDNPFSGNTATLAARFSRILVAKEEVIGGESIDPLLLLLRSAANPRAAEILKSGIVRHFSSPLGAIFKGDHIDLRVAMFLAQIAGFQLMRDVIKLDPLLFSDVGLIVKALENMFELQISPRMTKK
jgi:AcrR family transcriptional regulator